MSIYEIIQELNQENGSNYKMEVLRKHADNKLLQRVLKMTYDRATFTYGISIKSLNTDMGDKNRDTISHEKMLYHGLTLLEERIATRELTGHAARDAIQELLDISDFGSAQVLLAVINRDLRINMGRSNINKVFKDLIVKPVYMRCGVYNEKTAKKVDIEGAYLQLKADGTYREFRVEDGDVTCISRSGEEYVYPELFRQLGNVANDGVYHGELTVYKDGVLLDRSTGNGIINSGDFDGYDLRLDLWDYITLEEYSGAKNKVKGTTPYRKRFFELVKMLKTCSDNYHIYPIETRIVDSMKEALQYTSHWMNEGLEGAILKDKDAIFRDGTNPQQLKLKLEIDAEVRITGFTEGTPGTKREKTFGAITFKTDDGHVIGQTSGFTDAQLEDFNSRREELIGTIMTVQFNDITKGRNNDYYALSHPRFIELRPDRDDTDTLERIEASKQMAMELS